VDLCDGRETLKCLLNIVRILRISHAASSVVDLRYGGGGVVGISGSGSSSSSSTGMSTAEGICYRQHGSQDYVTTQAPPLRQSRNTFDGIYIYIYI
jgi:hypothetical protein